MKGEKTLKTRMIIQLEQEQHERLKAESARTGAPISEIVRRAIEAALKKKEAAQ